MSSVFFNKKSNENEYFPTSKYVAEKLVDLLPLDQIDSAIDPCAGDGILGLTLKAKYPNIELDMMDIKPKAADVEKVDFLSTDITKHYDVAILNPPFSLTEQFIDKCRKIADHILVICPQQYLKRLHIEKLYLDEKVLLDFLIMAKMFLSYMKSSTMLSGVFNISQLRIEQFDKMYPHPADYNDLKIIPVKADDPIPTQYFGQKAIIAGMMMGGCIIKAIRRAYIPITNDIFFRNKSTKFNGRTYPKGERQNTILIIGPEQKARTLLLRAFIYSSSLFNVYDAIQKELRRKI